MSDSIRVAVNIQNQPVREVLKIFHMALFQFPRIIYPPGEGFIFVRMLISPDNSKVMIA